MYQKFVDNIINKKLIDKGDKVLACVSGGADSMSMLHMLIRYFESNNQRIEVAHFDHQLRGKDSQRDLAFVKEFCHKNNLKFHFMSMDIKRQAEIEKLSIEECGRKYRYKFFYDLTNKSQRFKIALAHNLDDQAETVFMRIIRGTGIDGLTAIKEKDGSIIRPILTISRREIEEYIRLEKIDFVQDETNFVNDYTRNKLRNQIIPMIEKSINPSFKSALVNLSIHAKSNKKIVDEHISLLYSKIVKREDKSTVYLDRYKFEKIKEYIQMQIIRHVILSLRGHLNGFDFAHYKEFLNLINSTNGKEIIINKISISISNDLFIIKFINDNPLDHIQHIKGNDKIQVNGFDIVYSLDKYQAVIRKRKNGDRILYNKKIRKLKDFFIDKKIDLADRDFYPIIEVDKVIVAVGDIYIDMVAIQNLGIKLKINGGLEYGHF